MPPAATRLRVFTAALALLLFWLGYDSGTYGLVDRGTLAIAIWWTVIVVLALGLAAPVGPPRSALVVGALLAAFAGWTLLSAAWAPSAEDVVAEFNRVSLYLGVFVLVVLAARRTTLAAWSDAIAIGIVGVSIVALASRLFPGLFSLRGLPEFLPASRSRLSFPVDYWNGLAILNGLAVPPLLRLSIAARTAPTRALALAPFPALAAVAYLTSSRGGLGTAALATLVLFILASHRWLLAAAAGVAAAGAAGAIWVLVVRPELANAPGSQLAMDEGRSAALLLAVLCAAVGIVWGVLSGGLPRAPTAPAWANRLALAAGAIAAAAVVASSDPVGALDTFRKPPDQVALAQGDFTRAHLLSGGGSGRWQFWETSFDQFAAAPLHGDGAGSFESWWAQHGSLAYFTRDAHSLYVEVLGELGIVGFAILAAAFGCACAFGLRRTLAATGEDRLVTATLCAVLGGFLVAAAIDWVWELTIVSIVGIVATALLVGSPASRLTSGRGGPAQGGFAAGIGVIVVAWLVICVQVVPLLGDLEIRSSAAAVRRGDSATAAAHAERARALRPWGASGHLQIALVAEQAGELRRARRAMAQALERDRRDWRLWLIAARLQTKDGAVDQARQSLARAASLNPRSPLFARVQP